MGKLKVSFTTVLFVFSFIICVIVAVVFVDRGPRDDYDSFYESADENPDRESRDSDPDNWKNDNNNRQQSASAAAPNPAAQPTAPDESSFADLPLDAHLKTAAQPVPYTPTPAPTANPMQGQSPEQIARSLMGRSGISPALSEASVPQMAVPPGIATPAQQNQGQQMGQQQIQRQRPGALPLQSNVAADSMGGGISGGGLAGTPGSGLYGLPSLGSDSTNASDGWSAVSPRQTPDRMMGVRSAPSDPQNGMMISRGETAPGADAPAGFEQPVTSHTPASATAPGGFGEPLLLQAPPAQGGNKWDLPAAPTLRPPPIQDPDRPQSDADPASSDLPTPDSMNPDGSSGQALAISEGAENSSDEAGEPAHVAKVNNRTLTAEQAVKLAEVSFQVNDDILTEDKRDAEAKKAADTWADIVAAAEFGRANGISVPVPDVEKYAGMRPDFDPAAWQKAMAEKGFAQEEIRQLLLDMAVSEKLVEMDFEQEIDEEAIRNAYEKKPSQFAAPRKVHLLEIFKDKPDDEKRAEKVAASMRRLQRQAASGTDFGLLARQASQSDTRMKGGDLGWIVPTESKDELRDKAIAGLEPGQVSEVVEEPDGYRIYKLTEVQEARDDFEGGKELVVAELKKPIREDSLKEAREKLESGEPLVMEKFVTAKATPKTSSSPETEAASAGSSEVDEKPATDDLSPEDAERRRIAQQVLADARARKNGDKPGQQPSTISQAPVSVQQQPGPSNQLLYAPGSQVQQMGGGQPAPPYQPGGQTPAPPVFSAMTVPESVSVDGNVSVSYSPGQTMRIGETPAPTAETVPYQPVNYAAEMNPGIYPGSENATMAPEAYPQGVATQQTPVREEVTQSNGWSVTKSVTRPNQENVQASMQPEAEPAPSHVTVPPGFEASVPGGADADNSERENKGGLIGNVKSFFGGLRR